MEHALDQIRIAPMPVVDVTMCVHHVPTAPVRARGDVLAPEIVVVVEEGAPDVLARVIEHVRDNV